MADGILREPGPKHLRNLWDHDRPTPRSRCMKQCEGGDSTGLHQKQLGEGASKFYGVHELGRNDRVMTLSVAHAACVENQVF